MSVVVSFCVCFSGIFFHQTPSTKTIENKLYRIVPANNSKLAFRFVSCVINIRLSHGLKCFKINNFWKCSDLKSCVRVCLYMGGECVLMLHLNWERENWIAHTNNEIKLAPHNFTFIIFLRRKKQQQRKWGKNRRRKTNRHTHALAWSHQSEYWILKALALISAQRKYKQIKLFALFVRFASLFFASLFRYNFHAYCSFQHTQKKTILLQTSPILSFKRNDKFSMIIFLRSCSRPLSRYLFLPSSSS